MRGFIATLAAAAILLAACSSDDSSELEIGSVVVSRTPVDITKTKSEVLLPTGRLIFRAGKPQTRLSAGQSPEGERVQAPGGGSFVPLRWTYRTRLFEGARAIFGGPRPLSVSLVADGERYPVTPPSPGADGSSRSDLFVAVAGRPEQLEVKVEYAGVTQTADLRSGRVRAGRAALLAQMKGFDVADQSECDTRGWEASGVQPFLTWGCAHSDVAITPFLGGRFAKRGHAFAVLALTTNLEGRTDVGKSGTAVFLPTEVTDRTTLDGRRPLERLTRRDTPRRPGLSELVLAWRVSLDEDGTPVLPDAIRFEQEYDVRLGELKGVIGVDRKRDTFTLEGDVPVVVHEP